MYIYNKHSDNLILGLGATQETTAKHHRSPILTQYTYPARKQWQKDFTTYVRSAQYEVLDPLYFNISNILTWLATNGFISRYDVAETRTELKLA